MKIFHRLTLRILKKNKMRTLVTVIGIVLSMTLFVAVLEGAWSGLVFLRNVEAGESGQYHGILRSITEETENKVRKIRGVDAVKPVKEVGFADVNPDSDTDPYMYILSVDKNDAMLPVHMVSGRLPKNSDEIAISENMIRYTGDKLKTGDTVHLKVGSRILQGQNLPAEEGYHEGEKLTDVTQRTYKITGICERPSGDLVPMSLPGFIAVTVGDSGDGVEDLAFTVKNPYHYSRITESNTLLEQAVPHLFLLEFYGQMDQSRTAMLAGLVSVLVIMILVGSVSLIYNSFAISVSERTRQYGMLRSLGATKKQIRSSVYYEAFLMSLAGIPAGLLIGCGGIGITMYALRDTFDLFSRGYGGHIRLILNPWIILSAVVICLVTVLIAAVRPARRAVKISPIEAIRQTGDIKIDDRGSRAGKRSWHKGHFYRSMALKNYSRNRKRSRSTAFAIFLSVVLFISASSLVGAVKKEWEEGLALGPSSDVTASLDNEDGKALDVWKQYSHRGDVSRASLSISPGITEYFHFDDSDLTDEYKNSLLGMGGIYSNDITFLDDDTFRELCRENGLSPEKFTDPDNPQALMYNMIMETDSNGRTRKYRLIRKDSFPISVKADNYGDESAESFRSNTGMEPGTIDVTIGAELKEKPWFEDENEHIYYSQSMMEAVYGKELQQYLKDNKITESVIMNFMSADHEGLTKDLNNTCRSMNFETCYVEDMAELKMNTRMVIFAAEVFSYGFIILISLIAAANVFNIISTGVILRKREFAMLRSVGMSRRSLRKMLRAESFQYGFRALITGIPVSFAISVVIWEIVKFNIVVPYYPPVIPALIAAAVVSAIIFTSMWAAERRISTKDLMEGLRDENI